MANQKQRIIQNLISLAAIRGFSLVSSIVVLPFLIRTVGLENYGALAFTLSFSTFFGAFIQYGFGISASRDIARVKDDPHEVSNVFSTVFTTALVITIFATALYVLIWYIFFSDTSEFMLYLGAILLTIFVSLFPHWIFLGLGYTSVIAIITLGLRLIYLVLLFVFISSPKDYVYVHILNAFSAALALLSAFLYLRFVLDIRIRLVGVKAVKKQLSLGFKVFLVQFSPLMYNNFAIFFVGMLAPPITVGVFSAASSFIEVVISLGRLSANAVLPILSENINGHKIFARYMHIFSTCLLLSVLILADQISFLLSTQNQDEIAWYIRAIAISIPLSFCFIIYNVNFLSISGYENVAAQITVVISTIAMLAAFVFIPTFGGWGAVATIVFARFGMGGASYYAYTRLKKSNHSC